MKRAELLSFFVTCLSVTGTDSNLPRKSIFSKKLIANRPKMIARRDVYRKDGIRPLLLEPTKAVGITGEPTERKFGTVQEKNKPSGEGESPCKHRANVHLRRLQGRMPLTPMPPSGGRLRGHEPQKATKQQPRAGPVVYPWQIILAPRFAIQSPVGAFFFSSLYQSVPKEKTDTSDLWALMENFQKGLVITSMLMYND